MRIGKRVVRELGILRLHVLELSHLPARIRNQVHVTVDQSRQHEARALVDDPLTVRIFPSLHVHSRLPASILPVTGLPLKYTIRP